MRIAAVLASFAFLSAGATAAAPERGLVIGRNAIAGPALSSTRIAWLRVRTGRCGRAVVMSYRTLRHHDLGHVACVDEGQGTLPLFVRGAGIVLWVQRGWQDGRFVQKIVAFGARGRTFSDYVMDRDGAGSLVTATAGNADNLLYSVVTRKVARTDDARCAREGPPCALVVARSVLWSLSPRGWKRLPAPWAVGALAVNYQSVAMARFRGAVIEIRHIPNWRVERRVKLAHVRKLALSFSFVAALRSDGVVSIFTREGGALLITLPVWKRGGRPLAIAMTWALVVAYRRYVYVYAMGGNDILIRTRHVYPSVAIGGRRVAWRDGDTIRLIVLPSP
jgi:hypothetical protein